jgi:uncharacterized membrane protein YdjX (TVP38/TMEM64 family)
VHLKANDLDIHSGLQNAGQILMSQLKGQLFWIILICLIATAGAVYFLGGIQTAELKAYLKQAGFWAPLVYILIYVVATVLMLPSTALNLMGGALFGLWLGTLWTSIAAIIAALVSFLYTRTIGQRVIKKRFKKWEKLDSEIQRGGIYYIFAIRLLPIIPYGLVNFVAGLTSVSFKDYTLGTIAGTVPGLMPFVFIGSSGLTAIKTGNTLPLVGALSLTGLLVIGATLYQRQKRSR